MGTLVSRAATQQPQASGKHVDSSYEEEQLRRVAFTFTIKISRALTSTGATFASPSPGRNEPVNCTTAPLTDGAQGPLVGEARALRSGPGQSRRRGEGCGAGVPADEHDASSLAPRRSMGTSRRLVRDRVRSASACGGLRGCASRSRNREQRAPGGRALLLTAVPRGLPPTSPPVRRAPPRGRQPTRPAWPARSRGAGRPSRGKAPALQGPAAGWPPRAPALSEAEATPPSSRHAAGRGGRPALTCDRVRVEPAPEGEHVQLVEPGHLLQELPAVRPQARVQHRLAPAQLEVEDALQEARRSGGPWCAVLSACLGPLGCGDSTAPSSRLRRRLPPLKTRASVRHQPGDCRRHTGAASAYGQGRLLSRVGVRGGCARPQTLTPPTASTCFRTVDKAVSPSAVTHL